MTFLEFIRLIINHIKLIVLIPIIMTSLVFFLIKDSKKEYITKTSIYTGFASGYSIASSDITDYNKIVTKFDNFFQNIRSRETREEVILKTLAFYLAKETIATKDMSLENQQDFFFQLNCGLHCCGLTNTNL